MAQQPAWKKAIERTVVAQRSARFMWGGEAVLAVAGGAWLTAIASDKATIAEQVVRAVGGGLLGLLSTALLILIFWLIRSPYLQRDEALAKIARLEDQLAGLGMGNGLLPVSKTFTMHLLSGYDFAGHIFPARWTSWNDDEAMRKLGPEWTLIVRLSIAIAASPKTLVENITLDFMGKQGIRPTEWVSETIGAEVVKDLTFPIEQLPTPGDHPIRLVALVDGQRRYVDDQITYPSPSVR